MPVSSTTIQRINVFIKLFLSTTIPEGRKGLERLESWNKEKENELAILLPVPAPSHKHRLDFVFDGADGFGGGLTVALNDALEDAFG